MIHHVYLGVRPQKWSEADSNLARAPQWWLCMVVWALGVVVVAALLLWLGSKTVFVCGAGRRVGRAKAWSGRPDCSSTENKCHLCSIYIFLTLKMKLHIASIKHWVESIFNPLCPKMLCISTCWSAPLPMKLSSLFRRLGGRKSKSDLGSTKWPEKLV